MITDEKLRELAGQVAMMAKTEIRYKKSFAAILATYNVNDHKPVHRLRKIEKLMVELAGEDWCDKPAAKSGLYDVLCFGAHAIPPDAIIVAHVGNLRPIDAAGVVGEKQHTDYLVVIAQTAETVLTRLQELRGSLLIGEPYITAVPQSVYDDSSNFKLYGREPSKELLDKVGEMIREGWRPG